MSKKIICVSGGFDPVHVGHLRMMQAASQFGDVVVIVNSDDWLMRKKGYIFMPFRERCEILRGFACVADTAHVDDRPIEGLPGPGPVVEALRRIQPHYFANGGDRKNDNTPEMDVCKELGIEMVWNVGGGKIQSSSTLVADSPMLGDMSAGEEAEGLTPTRVEVVQCDTTPKLGDY